MRNLMLLAVGLGCVACSSDGGGSERDASANGGGRDASVNSGGRSGVAGAATTTGGSAGSTGKTAAGGNSGTPGSGAADGGGTSGVTSSGGSSGRLRDAGNDAADASSAEGDGATATCAGHHQSPAGRYTLLLHSVEQSTQFTGSPGCAVIASSTTDHVVTATLLLHEGSGSTFDSKTNKIYPSFTVYGTLHAAGADLTDAPMYPYDVHWESYSDYPAETPFLGPDWLSADAGVTNPNPFRVSTVTPGSDIPACWGMAGCTTPLDEVVISFDTTTWSVQFSRSFHHYYDGCGAVFTSTQTGTGHLDCGDG